MRARDSDKGLLFKYDKSRSVLRSPRKSPRTLNPYAVMLTYRGHSSFLRFYTKLLLYTIF